MGPDDALIWKALADSTRRQLLDMLRDHGQTTGALCAQFAPQLSRFAVIKHLQVLQEAQLVLVRQQGREKWHYLNAVPLRHVYERWVGHFASHWAASLVELQRTAEQSSVEEKPVMETVKIEQEVVIAAEPKRVFEALTVGVNSWWAHGYQSPQSTVHLEPHAGGRFYEDFAEEQGSAYYATVTYCDLGKKLCLMGPMGMSGPVVGTITIDLEPEDAGTRVKLSHQIMGAVDEDSGQRYTSGWQELLGDHLRRFVEEGKSFRDA
jgi:uncharacterized protein YndB with AHSA1/START domain/DNA-binding transcriptional ArsR family regulator